jgi:hypothetical protein
MSISLVAKHSPDEFAVLHRCLTSLGSAGNLGDFNAFLQKAQQLLRDVGDKVHAANDLWGKQVANDMVLLSLTFAEAKDVVAAGLACKRWQGLSRDDRVWEQAYRQRWWDDGNSMSIAEEGAGTPWLWRFGRRCCIEENWRQGRFAERKLEGHTDMVNDIQIAGGLLASCSGDETIRVWDLSNGHCTAVLRGHTDGVTCLRFDGHVIVSGSMDLTVRLWDCRLSVHRVLRGHEDAITSLAWDSRQIASGSFDKTIRIWNRATGECEGVLRGHSEDVSCLAFNGCLLVSGSFDCSIRVWDLESMTCTRTLDVGSEVSSLLVTNSRVVAGCWDGYIRVFRLVSGEQVSEIEVRQKYLQYELARGPFGGLTF